MYNLYPLKFKPILKHRIWGGNKIRTVFEIDDPQIEKCGEAWILSALPENETIVVNGQFAGNTLSELIEVFMDDLVGEDAWNKYKEVFPLLLKIIDAQDYLSVQVHPDDSIAKNKHNLPFGKSEMWYIIHAEPGAQIVAGFNKPIDKEILTKHIKQGTIKEILQYHQMQTGDIVYLPAGTVHATGPGLLMAEIQQSCDITYRLYDWDRKDENGQARELHVDDALEAIRFDAQPKIIKNFRPMENDTKLMIDTPYFKVSYLSQISKIHKNFELLDIFVLYFCLDGKFSVLYNRNEQVDVFKGECVLVPAIVDSFDLISENKNEIIEICCN